MRLISLACLVALLGCGTDPDDFGRCTGNITLTITQETNPQFAWTPADCEMHELNVTLLDGLVFWLISSNDTENRLSSPLHYGQPAPPGTSSTGSAPLGTGFFYTVDLWRMEEGIGRRVVSQRFQHQVQ